MYLDIRIEMDIAARVPFYYHFSDGARCSLDALGRIYLPLLANQGECGIVCKYV